MIKVSLNLKTPPSSTPQKRWLQKQKHNDLIYQPDPGRLLIEKFYFYVC